MMLGEFRFGRPALDKRLERPVDIQRVRHALQAAGWLILPSAPFRESPLFAAPAGN